MTRLSSALLARPQTERPADWVAFLQSKIKSDWRPGEFDHERLVFVPDTNNPCNTTTPCRRTGCTILLRTGGICPGCRKEHKRDGGDLSLNEWARIVDPPRRFRPAKGCAVPQCPRSHASLGLCATHKVGYKSWRSRMDMDYTIEQWIADRKPVALDALSKCAVACCGRDIVAARSGQEVLCKNHRDSYRRWSKDGGVPDLPTSVEVWLNTQVEPPMDTDTLSTYAEASATPFALLPEPLRWELLYAVQQRDLTGRTQLDCHELRHTYLFLRRAGRTTVVGGDLFERPAPSKNRHGVLREWQRHLDDAYREWTGVDERDPRLVYLRDIELRRTHRNLGPNSAVNLRDVEQDWIVDAVKSWLHAGARGYDEAVLMGQAWRVAAQTLQARGTPVRTLGAQDMDAVVGALRRTWERQSYQRRAIRSVRVLIGYARADSELEEFWRHVPARFAVDQSRHKPNGVRSRGDSRRSPNGDEPFRFVPQPIVDHVMDHLHLVVRRTNYLTAEARAILFVHERCGRRPGETIRLEDDCISYDNQGAPYLEWRQGKPPYGMGKRLPIHQETHDLIRQWQDVKREHDVTSKWLFPSNRFAALDKHWSTSYVNNRVIDLVQTVGQQVPFGGPVEGAEGNLIHFDLNSIDAYAFRHAFAQRFADATDADGRPTTPPDVLQEYMGHASFDTTMAYYEVTAKRRKQALAAIAPRRLNLLGEVVAVDRERDGFTKVAVTLGHCAEPQNVAAQGHGCMVEHACESCPFFLVDPLERDSMDAKRQALRVKYERARAINAQQHLLDHYEARIKDCTTIIDGIDAYVAALPGGERERISDALSRMADVRRRATAPRSIDVRTLLRRTDEA